MKFLVFSDVHEDMKQINKLEKRAKEEDIEFIIVAGDFTTFNRSLRVVFKKFNSWGKPVYVIPGNHEEGEEYDNTIKEYSNLVDLHKSAVERDNYVFLGFGGDGFSRQDPEFRKIARKWYGNFKNKKVVLITHGPAYKSKLDKLGKRHIGNIDYRKFIERIKPKLAISGHLHETIGEIDKIGNTKLINPCWDGMVIELK
ncbi:hypothetical protein HOA92_03550 [archaeon]|jgi:uncharacterized protein|nr:hypothetical protein [archaeon]MBT6762087.1 hypothetical protein [archaeon]